MTVTITAFEQSPDGGKGLARDTRVRWELSATCPSIISTLLRTGLPRGELCAIIGDRASPSLKAAQLVPDLASASQPLKLS